MKYRYLSAFIEKDLREKMVFLGGPRQVGKTFLSLGLLKSPPKTEENPAYLSWDNAVDQMRILKNEIPDTSQLILDEIHKYKRWRNWVKGLYDKRKSRTSILVTGSARLDFYRRGGDSLQGRYHFYRLHPFCISELGDFSNRAALNQLLTFGGFPEPFLKADPTHHRRWQKERVSRVLREDLRDLEKINEVSEIALLLSHLPNCVGSPLSINSLRTLIQKSHPTISKWISMLENLYLCYRIYPFTGSKIRAVKKEAKLYFWDWSQIEDPGSRKENFVASHLLKWCHFVEDTQGFEMELRFLRDTDKREVDFVVLKDRKPLFAIECKSGEKSPHPSTFYFRERTNIPQFYQVHFGEKDYGDPKTGTRVLPFQLFCKEMLKF